jgi:hypothetical protein
VLEGDSGDERLRRRLEDRLSRALNYLSRCSCWPRERLELQ